MTYRTETGIIVKTENAHKRWSEATDWDGSNEISRNTNSQWDHETLYLSKKGNYWLEQTSQWQGSVGSAKMLTREEAAGWLVLNGKNLPADLADLAEEVSE